MRRVAAEIDLPARSRFDLRATVASNPRAPLPPWAWEGGRHPRLRRAERLHGRYVYLLEIRPAPAGVVLRVVGPRADEVEQLAPLAARVRRALQLDLDLTDLHRRCRATPALGWIARHGLGRIVHGTTLFEDCVTALLGDGDATRLMAFGPRCPEARALHAYPTPAELAALGTRGMRAHIGMGHHAAAVAQLACAAAAGNLDRAALDDRAATLSRSALTRRLAQLPGLTREAVATLVPVLGHHAGLRLDRAMVRDAGTVLLAGRRPTARALRHHLAGLGPWRGLALVLCAARGAATASGRG